MLDLLRIYLAKLEVAKAEAEKGKPLFLLRSHDGHSSAHDGPCAFPPKTKTVRAPTGRLYKDTTDLRCGPTGAHLGDGEGIQSLPFASFLH
jgi:hypothetical protein